MVYQTIELLKDFSEKINPDFCTDAPPSSLDRWRQKAHFPVTLKVKTYAWKATRNHKPFL